MNSVYPNTSFAASRIWTCDARSSFSIRVATEGATWAIWEAVCWVLVVSRPARISRAGECLEIVSANSAPRPPGDTPVMRMVLSLMVVERSEAIWSPSVRGA